MKYIPGKEQPVYQEGDVITSNDGRWEVTFDHYVNGAKSGKIIDNVKENVGFWTCTHGAPCKIEKLGHIHIPDFVTAYVMQLIGHKCLN